MTGEKMSKIIYQNKEYEIPIIFEDNHLLIVEKPVGMLSQEDHTGEADILNILKEFLRIKYNKPGEIGRAHV